MTVFTQLINFSQTTDLRDVAAEGMAKLLVSCRVMSHKLLSRLLLLWYNPVTEDDTRLRHCIGGFLPMFAFASRYSLAVAIELLTISHS